MSDMNDLIRARRAHAEERRFGAATPAEEAATTAEPTVDPRLLEDAGRGTSGDLFEQQQPTPNDQLRAMSAAARQHQSQRRGRGAIPNPAMKETH